MNSYVDIQIQSSTQGVGFVAQWYAGGERSGRAFALANLGELLFFAFFVEAPMVVADDATRAMLCERGIADLVRIHAKPVVLIGRAPSAPPRPDTVAPSLAP